MTHPRWRGPNSPHGALVHEGAKDGSDSESLLRLGDRERRDLAQRRT